MEERRGVSAHRRVDTTPPPDPVPSDGKSRILLQVAAAANGEPVPDAVLGPMARVVVIAAVDDAATVTVGGDPLSPHAIHVAGVETRHGESFVATS